MSRAEWVLNAALAVAIVGMMLVIAGVLAPGLFLPGVVLLALGLLGFAVAGVLEVLPREDQHG